MLVRGTHRRRLGHPCLAVRGDNSVKHWIVFEGHDRGSMDGLEGRHGLVGSRSHVIHVNVGAVQVRYGHPGLGLAPLGR